MFNITPKIWGIYAELYYNGANFQYNFRTFPNMLPWENITATMYQVNSSYNGISNLEYLSYNANTITWYNSGSGMYGGQFNTSGSTYYYFAIE